MMTLPEVAEMLAKNSLRMTIKQSRSKWWVVALTHEVTDEYIAAHGANLESVVLTAFGMWGNRSFRI